MQPYKDGDSIYTTLNPINRYTMPEEVAEYALLLVSSLGNTIVGDTIYMSGGRGIIEIR
jgi:enoyl-[acyl-carrier-protein] reductase (NADH)